MSSLVLEVTTLVALAWDLKGPVGNGNSPESAGPKLTGAKKFFIFRGISKIYLFQYVTYFVSSKHFLFKIKISKKIIIGICNSIFDKGNYKTTKYVYLYSL